MKTRQYLRSILNSAVVLFLFILALAFAAWGCNGSVSSTEAGPPVDGLKLDSGVKDKGPSPDTAPGKLFPGVLGQHSAVVAHNSTLMASGYERSYGDLVMVTAKTSALNTMTKEIVDGVPANATASADPKSWRKGIEDKGDDVGRDTDIIISAANAPMISYRDVTNRSLKFAVKSGTKWSVHTVNKPKGTKDLVGRYSSMILLNKKPAIAYLALNLDAGNKSFKSELRWAAAGKEVPAAIGDWTVTVIDSQPMSCQNLCEKGDVCVPDSTGKKSSCKTTSSGCTKCADGTACVGGKCVTIIANTAVTDVPKAVGLWAVAVNTMSGPMVVYHDRINGNLKGAINSSGKWSTEVLQGTTTDNVGAFCSAAVDKSGTVHISHQNAAKGTLHYLQVKPPALKATLTEVIDNGIRSDGLHLVGADSAIVVEPFGTVRVAYQDATTADLMAAKRAGANNWTPRDGTKKDLGRTIKGGKRGYGFYSDLTLDGAAVFGSNFFYDQQAVWPTAAGNLEFFNLK